MSTILEFIKVFQSPSNHILFTECACYWFSVILHQRFPDSSIVYDPQQVHFATKIHGVVYDITGIVEDDADYIDWEYYSSHFDDADMVIEYCIKMKGGENR